MISPEQAAQVFVRVTTTDAGSLLPALIRLGASIHIRRGELDVWGLSANQVARVAAAQLAAVTDLETLNRPHHQPAFEGS